MRIVQQIFSAIESILAAKWPCADDCGLQISHRKHDTEYIPELLFSSRGWNKSKEFNWLRENKGKAVPYTLITFSSLYSTTTLVPSEVACNVCKMVKVLGLVLIQQIYQLLLRILATKPQPSRGRQQQTRDKDLDWSSLVVVFAPSAGWSVMDGWTKQLIT